MSSPDAHERSAFEAVARLYRAEGYTVEEANLDPALAPQLANVDLIARKAEETVYVEIRRTSRFVRPSADAELPALAEAVRGLINARLDVVTVPDPSDVLPDRQELIDRAARASLLAATEEDEPGKVAAFLLTTSALEGALRVLASRSEIYPDPDSTIGGLAANLWSIGLLSEPQWEGLQAISATRDALAHGLRPGRSLSGADQALAEELVQTFVTAAYLTAEDLVTWFHANYKSPEHGVPYDGREGGYQYISGGPYDASDVLGEAFLNAPLSVVDEALAELSGEGDEWVGADEY
jgi:hypothetical protein